MQYDEVFAARSCSYDVVLEQDKKFVEVEAALPEPYQFRGFFDEPQTSTVQRGIVIHSCYSTEIMRLHRPFLCEPRRLPRCDAPGEADRPLLTNSARGNRQAL